MKSSSEEKTSNNFVNLIPSFMIKEIVKTVLKDFYGIEPDSMTDYYTERSLIKLGVHL